MKKFFAIMLIAVMLASISGVRLSYAGEIDLLLQKLVEKGVLTPGEAQQIGTETKEQVKKEIAEGKYSSLPSWAQNIKLKGDFRLRFQSLHEKNTRDIGKDTTIGRIRVRLGLEGKVNDKLKVGVGIATGSGDPRSTNITLGGSQAKKTVILDYAYAKYDHRPWLSLAGGKMLLSDVLWEPTDLIWDTDITPEGASIGLQKALGPDTSVFLKTGPLVIVEDTSTISGAMAYLAQPGITHNFSSNLSLKAALTYAYFQMKDSVASSYSKGQNTKNGTSYRYNYSILNPALEFSLKEPFKAVGLNVESLKLFGEYVNNLQVAKKNTGLSAGLQFGNAKVEKWGDWQFRYVYAMLEKDSVLDILPDSDRYSGKTGMRSHEASINFGLAKNTSIGVDVYRSWNIVGTATKAPETLVQVDWNMKF
ncbi:MAG: putative porin [Candidatus Omnitrophota bacterium]